MSAPSTELPLAVAPALPALRLVPAPPCAPPYDDELPAGRVRPAGLPSPLGPLRGLAPPPTLRLVPALPQAITDGEDERPRARTPAALLPPARPVAHALVQGLLEVLAGVRPISQLQRATTPELFAELELAVLARPRDTGRRPATGAVRSLHVQERCDGVAEVCATVHSGPRVLAVVLRLEGLSGRWTCTELNCV